MNEPNRLERAQIDRQRIIDFYHAYINAHKHAPTMAEVAIGIGRKAASKSKVKILIDDLIAKGWLERVAGLRDRAIQPVRSKRGKVYYEWKGE